MSSENKPTWADLWNESGEQGLLAQSQLADTLFIKGNYKECLTVLHKIEQIFHNYDQILSTRFCFLISMSYKKMADQNPTISKPLHKAKQYAEMYFKALQNGSPTLYNEINSMTEIKYLQDTTSINYQIEHPSLPLDIG